MRTSRRSFLKILAGVPGLIAFPGLLRSSSFGTLSAPGMKPLRGQIGIYSGRGGTIAWFIDTDAVTVIDTQYPESAEKFVIELKTQTARTIDFVFNTHHHRDHTWGNYILKPYADKFVAHQNVPALQEKQAKEQKDAPQQVYADTTFADQWRTEIGKEIITARYFGPAHTGGDSVVHFEKANVAHVGDLVFNKVLPFIDSNGGGSIRSWIDVIEKLAKAYSNDTLYIFGHSNSDEGCTGSVQDVKAMRDYLSALLEFVEGKMKSGEPKEKIIAYAAIPKFEYLIARWEGAMKQNLTAAFDELNTK